MSTPSVKGVIPLANGQKREDLVGANHATLRVADQYVSGPCPYAGVEITKDFSNTGLQYVSSVPYALPAHTERYSLAASEQVYVQLFKNIFQPDFKETE